MNELWVASYVVLWTIVAGLSVILVGVLRQLGVIALRLGPEPGALITREGLERGALAPDFAAGDVRTGHPVRLGDFRGQRVLLVFVTPTCIACRQIASDVNDLSRARRGDLEAIVVCYGSAVTCGEFASAYRLKTPLLVDATNAIAESYDVRMTPFGYLIDEDGVVRIRGVVNSFAQLEALIEEEGTVNPQPWPLPTGAAKPSSESPLSTSEHVHATEASVDADVART